MAACVPIILHMCIIVGNAFITGISEELPAISDLIDLKSTIGERIFVLGTKLLSDKKMDELKEQYPSFDELYFRVFRQWVGEKPPPSWKILISRLKEMGMGDVVDKISKDSHGAYVRT